jgi:hypothetical protein
MNEMPGFHDRRRRRRPRSVGFGRARYASVAPGTLGASGRVRVSATVTAVCWVAGLALAASIPFSAPAHASTITGLVRAPAGVSAYDSTFVKTAVSYCPQGKRVLGGGGSVLAAGGLSERLTLTQLQPARLVDGSRDGYVVTAAETSPGTTVNWSVTAYAICAFPALLHGYEIVASPLTALSSQSPQATAAVCPSTKRVLGVGARISSLEGQVDLEVARASGSGDIARAQAHEDADGYTGSWRVTAFAVCVNPPDGYQVIYGNSEQTASETYKAATAVCPGDKRVHGAGAALSNVAPPGVSLQGVVPTSDLKRVGAVAVENAPTNQDWDFIVAQAICAF